VRKTKIMMIMEQKEISLSGGSDTRDRQREVIVPDFSRSGHCDKSSDGPLASCAASDARELVIAGALSACSAGAGSSMTPAMDRPRGEMPLDDQEEEKVKDTHPLRLHGGGKGDESSSEGDIEEPTISSKIKRKPAEDQTGIKGGVPSKVREQAHSKGDMIHVRRSRSRIKKGMKTRSRGDAQRRAQSGGDTTPSEEERETRRESPSSGSSTDRYVPAFRIKKEAPQIGDTEGAQIEPQIVTLSSDGENEGEKEASSLDARGKTDKRGSQMMDSGPSSSSVEDDKGNQDQESNPGTSTTIKKAKMTSNIPVRMNVHVQKLRAECAGKRGRPPTTGEYVRLAESKKAANDEKERELRLEREAKNFDMAEALQILHKGKLYPEDTAEEAALTPTADLASQVREAQAEIIRISKISSNLKGDLQRALRVSASLTMGLVDVLRTRADSTGAKTGEEELRRLKEHVEKLSKAQESVDERLNALKNELEVAKSQARREKEKRERATEQAQREKEKREKISEQLREEKTKAEKAMASLRDLMGNTHILKSRMKDLKTQHAEEIERLKVSLNRRTESPSTIQTVPELMEIAEEGASISTVPPISYSEAVSSPKGNKNQITREELEEFPALAPPLRGYRKMIPDRDLPPPEILEEEMTQRVSQKKRKGTKGPSWERMEVFSSISQVVEDLPLPPLPPRERKGPEASKTQQRPTRDTRKPEASKQRRTEATPRTSAANRPVTRRSEEAIERRKEKKREKRRLKRQREAARRQEQARQRTGSPTRSRQRQTQRDPPPHPAEDSGPASRTRARTRELDRTNPEVPRAQPPHLAPQNVIEDVRIPPDDWKVVKDRRKRGPNSRSRSRPGRKTYAGAAAATRPPVPTRKQERREGNQGNRQEKTRRQEAAATTIRQQQQRQPVLKKPPKTAAIQVVCPPGQCAETMRLARERVDIRRLGIEELRPRRARTGALLLEIPGANGASKADALAREMQEALRDREGVRVTRPAKTAEIRIKDLEDSVSAVEIANAIADSGECQVAEVQVGPIRLGTNRLGTAWVRCPLTAASRLLRKGKLTLGWTRARLELLQERPTTCFRCLQPGHVRAVCPNETDRSDLCYRCGETGHQARGCTAAPRCPLCAGTRRDANHRVGSRACKAPKRKERRGNATTTTTRRNEDRLDIEPMDIVQEEEPARPPISRPVRPVIEERPPPAPAPPSQPSRPITGSEPSRVGSPPQPPQPDWPMSGEGWSPDPDPQERRMKRRVLDIRAAPQETAVPPGTSHPTLPPSQVMAIGWREIDVDEEEEQLEGPVDADTGTPHREGTNDQVPPQETRTCTSTRSPVTGGDGSPNKS